MRYIPHTEDDIARMLRVIGKPSVASLFEHIPERLRVKRPLDIAPLDEGSLLAGLEKVAESDAVAAMAGDAEAGDADAAVDVSAESGEDAAGDTEGAAE